jgi:glycosyltransferase involved in cell wall biosynthesis
VVRFVRARPLSRVPRASVVVPCYKYGRYLPQLVRTVLAQPSVDVDILIVDDASPDGSGDVAERLAAKNPRVKVLRHMSNKGHIQTYNDGLQAVTGDYVVLLSADDLLPAGALTRAVALMEAHPDVGFVYGYARSFSGEPPAVNGAVRNWSVWPGIDWLRASARRGRSFISSPEVVMRSAALRQVGGYDPQLPHSGDLDMWLRTAARWDVGRVNGPVQALYRVHDANMHLTAYAGWLTDLDARRRTFSLLFDEHEPRRTDIGRLRKPAMRALANEALRRAMWAHRDYADTSLVRDYLEYAVETDPTIMSSAWWRVCQLGMLRDVRLPAAAARRYASRARHHIQWRLGRRYGI